jgi:hypothetical protein
VSYSVGQVGFLVVRVVGEGSASPLVLVSTDTDNVHRFTPADAAQMAALLFRAAVTSATTSERDQIVDDIRSLHADLAGYRL